MKKNPPVNILVRVPNWIGDAVLCLPALMEIRDYFPQAKVTILARPTIGELLQGQSGVDDVMVYQHQREHKGFLGAWKLSQFVRKKRFDLAVLFQNAFEAAVIALLAGIPSRVGYETDGRGWLLSQGVPVADKKSLHQTQYYQRLAQAITHHHHDDLAPRLDMDPQVKTVCAKKFPEVFFPSDAIWVGINPGSVYGSAKRWMPERFAEMGDQLVERLTREVPESVSVRCLLVGGRGEESLGLDIARQMVHQPIILSGKTTIRELMGVLTRCAVLVTNDTGPMHIAKALGIPVVAIFGSTDPHTTGPYGQSTGVVRASVRCSPCLLRACPIDHRCMTQISVERVVEEVMSQVKASARPLSDLQA